MIYNGYYSQTVILVYSFHLPQEVIMVSKHGKVYIYIYMSTVVFLCGVFFFV